MRMLTVEVEFNPFFLTTTLEIASQIIQLYKSLSLPTIKYREQYYIKINFILNHKEQIQDSNKVCLKIKEKRW